MIPNPAAYSNWELWGNQVQTVLTPFMTRVESAFFRQGRVPRLASFVVAELPSAETPGELIYVSNETAGTPSTSHSVDNDIEKLGSFEHTTISQPSPKQGSISDDVKRTKPRNFLGNVLENIKGDGSKSPPRVSLVSTVLSGLFSFIGIFSVSFISHHGGAETLVIASFGGECA